MTLRHRDTYIEDFEGDCLHIEPAAAGDRLIVTIVNHEGHELRVLCTLQELMTLVHNAIEEQGE